MRAVVTAGGTSEPIDDVRVVTNLSTGRFGAAIANALAERGLEVDLLAGRALASHPEWLDPRVRVTRFGSFGDLDRAVSAALSPPPELLFMAAAVSDYAPVPTEGKIRSDAEQLTLVLKRNPKLLAGLRERCGVETFLVGFKLLSHVSRHELVETARRQVRDARANLCVANDLAELGGADHPVVLVTPEGGAIDLRGPRAEVARELVGFALRRRATRWYRGVLDPSHVPDPHGREDAAALLRVAVEGGLLPGREGNVSHRSARGLWTTRRGVEKAALGAEDLVHVEVDAAERVVRRGGERKPSIDAPVQAFLYRSFPEVQGLLHVHDGLVLDAAQTSFPWPCGTLEEAEHVAGTLLREAAAGRWDGGGFAVRLVHHGLLVGVRSARRLAAEWDAARAGYADHLRQIGVDPALAAPQPVLERDRVIGVCASFAAGAERGWSTWLDPAHRRGGRGERIADLLAERGRFALVGDACAVLDWYAERGWRVEGREGRFALLRPPSLRDDLVPAASACLVDPVGRRVLLGRRRTPPWLGYWAFPGGKLHPGEDVLEGALRELGEETGVRPPWTEVLGRTDVFVGDRPGFRVTNVQLLVPRADAPIDTDELEARWVPLDEARTLRPMAAGTRRVLRGLAPLLPRSSAS